jgi:hypothetical protein
MQDFICKRSYRQLISDSKAQLSAAAAVFLAGIALKKHKLTLGLGKNII